MIHSCYDPDSRSLVTVSIETGENGRCLIVGKLFAFQGTQNGQSPHCNVKSRVTTVSADQNRQCHGIFTATEKETGVGDQPNITVIHELHSHDASLIKCDHVKIDELKQVTLLVCDNVLRQSHKNSFTLFTLSITSNRRNNYEIDKDINTEFDDTCDQNHGLHFQEVFKFTCASIGLEEPHSVYILDGPVVVWLNKQQATLHYTSPTNQCKVSHNAAKIPEICQHRLSDVAEVNLLTVYQETDTVVVLLSYKILPHHKDYSHLYKGMDFSYHCMDLKTRHPIFHQMKSFQYIPSIYADIVTCAVITQIQGNRLSLWRETNNKTSFLMCTSYSQMLLFINGKTEKCVKIPFSDVCEIAISHSFGGDEFIFARSKKCGIVAVALTSFKVVQVWEASRHLTVGDFVGCGTDQVLLLEDLREPAAKFILTDLGIHYKEAASQVVDGSGDNAHNVEAATRALIGRLQAGQTALRETRQNSDMKQKLIRNTCWALQNMGLDEKTHKKSQSVHLLPLLGVFTSTTFSPSRPTETQQPVQPLVRVVCTKIKLIFNKVVFITTVVNRAERDVCNLAMSVIPKKGSSGTKIHSDSQSQDRSPAHTNSHPSPEQSDPSKSVKRFKVDHIRRTGSDTILNLPPNHTTQLSAFMDQPSFAINRHVEVNILIHWMYADAAEDSHSIVSFGGGMKFSVDDIFDNQMSVPVDIDMCHDLKAAEIQENLEFLDAIQEKTELTVSSDFTNLACVSHALSKLGFAYHDVYHCWMASIAGSALYLTRVVLQQENMNSFCMSIWTREPSDTMVVVHSLNDILPTDCVILPSDDPFGKQQEVRRALRALKGEIMHASNCLRNILKHSQSKSDNVNMDTSAINANDKIDIQRRDFLRQKHDLIQKTDYEIGDNHVKSSSDSLDHLKSSASNTDSAMIQMFKHSR